MKTKVMGDKIEEKKERKKGSEPHRSYIVTTCCCERKLQSRRFQQHQKRIHHSLEEACMCLHYSTKAFLMCLHLLNAQSIFYLFVQFRPYLSNNSFNLVPNFVPPELDEGQSRRKEKGKERDKMTQPG